MEAFHETSYARPAQGYASDLTDPQRKQIAASWFDPNTADSWRHARAYEIARHLGTPDQRWVTLGDGRFGLDAINLKRRGAGNVLATDLSEVLLRASKEQGHLSAYSIENAESLSFPDGSFDYAFCKESYHHFPRPMLALYEMLRVTSKGVILIEPNDREGSPLRRLRRLLGGSAPPETYEEDGNYVYSISEREMAKVALGLNMPQVALKCLNDAWTSTLWSEPASQSSAQYRKMRRKIAVRDLLCRLGIDHSMLLMALEGLYGWITSYLNEYRLVLLDGTRDPETFFVRNMREKGHDPEFNINSYYAAWKLIIQKYGIYNPYTKRGAIKGLLPHGPHAVRDVLATHLLKTTGSYELASFAIQDSMESVMRHYARFMPHEKIARAAEELNKVWRR